MKVFVKIFGSLQSVLGEERLEIEAAPGATVREVLDRVARDHLVVWQAEVWDAQARKFRIPIVVMVSNSDVNDYSLALEDGQEIALISPMAGG